MKRVNKMRLAEYIETLTSVKVSEHINFTSFFARKLAHLLSPDQAIYPIFQVSLDAMFDVQIKRIHEYKRQLLNILGIIHRYDCIKVSFLLLRIIFLSQT